MKLYNKFPIAFCLLASALFADSIPTYFASSATVTNEHGADEMSAQGPYFQIRGVENRYGGVHPPIFEFGDSTGQFSTITVDFLRNGNFFLAGGGVGVGVSSGDWPATLNPGSYTFPGTAEGGSRAFLEVGCGPGSPPGTPPCGTSANLVIDLPGIITVNVGSCNCLDKYSETFTTTPEPSSAALVILSSGAIFLAFAKARTKRRRDQVLKLRISENRSHDGMNPACSEY